MKFRKFYTALQSSTRFEYIGAPTVIIGWFIFVDLALTFRLHSRFAGVGVYLDKNLTMDKHVNQIVSHCYKILKDIGRIKKCLQQSHLERLVHSVISSRLDYCNSLFVNISKGNLDKLQKLQNAAARLVVGGKKRESVSGALRKLHWLRVEARITFKILLLVF